MTKYDPTKVEAWHISASGFWRAHEVNLTEHMIRVECTWDQCNRIYERWQQITHEQDRRRRSLDATLRAELDFFMKHPLVHIL